MTTTTPTIRPAAMLPPVEIASSVGLLRLARVELRKLVDTRAGLWLLVLSVVSAVAAAGLWLSLSLDDPQLPWYGPVSLVSAPVTVLLPVVAILAFTQEWSQRTSLTTFTLEPRRGRVIGAKLLAIALVTIAGALLCLALSAASALLASAIGSGTLVWAFEATALTPTLIGLVISMAMGAGFGMLLMNSPTAIVAYFVIPTITTTLSMIPGTIGTIGKWISGETWSMLFTPMTATQYGQAATALALWVVLPIALGWWRTLRTEAK